MAPLFHHLHLPQLHLQVFCSVVSMLSSEPDAPMARIAAFRISRFVALLNAQVRLPVVIPICSISVTAPTKLRIPAARRRLQPQTQQLLPLPIRNLRPRTRSPLRHNRSRHGMVVYHWLINSKRRKAPLHNNSNTATNFCSSRSRQLYNR